MLLEPLKSGGSHDNKTVRLPKPINVKLLSLEGGTDGGKGGEGRRQRREKVRVGDEEREGSKGKEIEREEREMKWRIESGMKGRG